MTDNISGWVTYAEMVDDILLSWGDTSDQGERFRILNFLIQGFEQLRLSGIQATRPVVLPVQTEMRVVALPSDFLKFVSVGMVNNGQFFPFNPKSDMANTWSVSCGITENVQPVETTPQITACYYYLDLENRRILIDAPLNVREVTLNYTPTGVRVDGETYIPRMCRAVVKAFAEYQLVLRNRSATQADKMLFEREHLKAINQFRGYVFDATELFDTYHEHIVRGKQY